MRSSFVLTPFEKGLECGEVYMCNLARHHEVRRITMASEWKILLDIVYCVS